MAGVIVLLSIPFGWFLALLSVCGLLDGMVTWRCFVDQFGVIPTYVAIRDWVIELPPFPVPSWVGDYLVFHSAIHTTLDATARVRFGTSILAYILQLGIVFIDEREQAFEPSVVFFKVMIFLLTPFIWIYFLIATWGWNTRISISGPLTGWSIALVVGVVAILLVSTDVPYRLLDVDAFFGVGLPGCAAP